MTTPEHPTDRDSPEDTRRYGELALSIALADSFITVAAEAKQKERQRGRYVHLPPAPDPIDPVLHELVEFAIEVHRENNPDTL